MTSHRLVSLTIATLVAVVLTLVSAAAGAQDGELVVQLIESELQTDGRTELVVTVEGPGIGDEGVPADGFTVTENGEPVEGVRVAPVVEEEDAPPSTVVIAFDISGSMAGEPLEAAREAARTFVETIVPQGIEVGLVPFGTDAIVAVPPTTDLGELTAAIDAFDLAGNTALYDAIVVSAGLLEGREGERTIVLFTDGADTASAAELEDAVAASVAAGAPLLNVALITPDQDPEVLDALADGTEGQLLAVDELDQLEAAFAQVAQSLTSGYVLRYSSEVLSEELDLSIIVEQEGQQGRVDAVLLNPREEFEAAPIPEPTPIEVPELGPLGEPVVLAIALFSAFAALALLFSLLFVPQADRAASRTLRRGVTMIQRGDSTRAQSASGVSASALGRAAMDLVERAPKPKGYDDRLQIQIDRAGWELRATEFTTLRIVSTVGGLAVLWALTGSFVFGVLGAVLGFFGPIVFLSSAKARRKTKFMQQLPDTLQLLAGTLKAGYGVLQAIDTVVKEVEDPTATEFQRALTEARLGLPLEDSLGDMAERIDSDDFRWVVVAMNIQRQVGGNLAELLETVAATLRGREQVRRQISALSAEGRLSAVILIALPFVILGFLLVSNPGYLAPLLTNVLGWFMLGIVSVLMLIGVLWIRKMIAIDV
jgi:tight adherence protein B